MEFMLTYRGLLKSNGSLQHKNQIRKHFHTQLARLWTEKPLKFNDGILTGDQGLGGISIVQSINGILFAPLVSEKLHLIADLEILLLRPEAPGQIITQSGDIDNRLKTLFDALRMPKDVNESNSLAVDNTSTPFYCLLEDDNLITSLSVTSGTLLEQVDNASEVLLVIKVKTKAMLLTVANMRISG